MCECRTAILEGWKAIGDALGITAGNTAALRKRLRGWERAEGLPVHRVRGRVFATLEALQAWAGNIRSVQSVTLRSIK